MSSESFLMGTARVLAWCSLALAVLGAAIELIFALMRQGRGGGGAAVSDALVRMAVAPGLGIFACTLAMLALVNRSCLSRRHLVACGASVTYLVYAAIRALVVIA